MLIVYIGILWANVTSIALFSKYLFGGLFQFGYLYSIAGYNVYIGEVLLCAAVLFLIGGLTFFNKKLTTGITLGMVLLFIAAIIFASLVTLIKQNGFSLNEVSFVGEENRFGQVMSIVAMSPWAFIGFESISHSAGDFSFKTKKTFKILVASITVSAVIYILLCQISVEWMSDIANKDPLTGVNNHRAYISNEKRILAAVNDNPDFEYGLVVCDLNDLKFVNDRFGHDYGDEYIIKGCKMICDTFKHSPVFRTGGDEFAVILEGEDYTNRQKLFSQLLDISTKNCESGECVVIAAGMAVRHKGESFHDVFHRADERMYSQKDKLKKIRPDRNLR